MPEFDLDSFKKTWQEQEVKEKYDNQEIIQMLNRKSRNNVRYILWISLLEFLMFLGITLYYVFLGNEEANLLNILKSLKFKAVVKAHGMKCPGHWFEVFSGVSRYFEVRV